MTTEPAPMTPDLQAIAHEALQKFVVQFEWQPAWLIAEESAEIVAHVQAKGAPEKAITAAALNRYCALWYAACCSTNPYQQHNAFKCLYAYLHRVALYQAQTRYGCGREYAEILAQDVAQATLVILWQKLGDVKDPGSFLGYVKKTMIHEMIRSLKQEGKAASLDQLGAAEMIEDETVTSKAAAQTAQAELPQPIEAAIRRCLRNQEQQQVVIENLLRNKTLQQIANELGKKSGTVRMLKQRALDGLRKCEELRNRMNDQRKPTAADPVRSFFQALAEQPDTALSCAIVESWLPSFIAAEVAGEDVTIGYPDLKRHLDLCPACEALYTEMMELALAEAADAIPRPASIPAPDLSFLPPLPSLVMQARTLVSQVTTQVLGLLAPNALPTLPALEAKFVQRVEALGGRLPAYRAPAATLSEASDPTTAALVTLSAALLTTQQIAIRYSAQALSAEMAHDAFYQTLQVEAIRIAQANGMTADDAQAFARIYADEVRANPAAWLAFVTAVQA